MYANQTRHVAVHREWYGWHFHELVQIVNDNYQYCKAAHLIGVRAVAYS